MACLVQGDKHACVARLLRNGRGVIRTMLLHCTHKPEHQNITISESLPLGLLFFAPYITVAKGVHPAALLNIIRADNTCLSASQRHCHLRTTR